MLVGANRFIFNDINRNLFIRRNLFLKPKSFTSYNPSRSYSFFTSKCNKFSMFNINKFSFRSFHKSRTINSQASKKPESISEIKILKTLFKYIWPKDNMAVKIRVIVSFSLLLLAKVLNIEVPFFFKKIIDDMNGDSEENADFVKDNAFPIAVAITILSYGLARFGAVLFGELRNAVFAKVSQNAIKTVSLQTFKHLMKLDLNWHLSRQTGGLTRAMDRGTKGISYVLSAMVLPHYSDHI
ncbi:unnamed protein product [Hanseniaspora opuntiae]